MLRLQVPLLLPERTRLVYGVLAMVRQLIVANARLLEPIIMKIQYNFNSYSIHHVYCLVGLVISEYSYASQGPHSIHIWF